MQKAPEAAKVAMASFCVGKIFKWKRLKKLKCKKKIDKKVAIVNILAYNILYRYEGRNENEV